MAKKMLETKVAEAILEGTDNNWFNPTLVAHALVTGQPIYTQDKVMDLIVEIIRQQSNRYDREWEEGRTSEGLMMASRLMDMITNFEPIE
jgi:hypothetical protein